MIIKKSQLLVALLTLYLVLADENLTAVFLVLSLSYLGLVGAVRSDAIGPLGLMHYFALMVLCAGSTAFLSPFPFNPYFVLRDVFYFFAPIALLLLGFRMGKRAADARPLLNAMLVVFTLVSLYQNRSLLFGGGLGEFTISARYELGLNSDVATLAFVIVMTSMAFGHALGSPGRTRFLLLINLFFVVASFSRANLGVVVISSSLQFLRRRWLGFTAVIIGFILLVLPLVASMMVVPERDTSVTESFMQKVAGSLSEIAIRDYDTLAGINTNWRGYEAFMGMKAVHNNGTVAVIFGLGYGSYVEGPFEEKLNVIPIFHNGYVTVFMKGGLLGIVLFLLFLARLSRGRMSEAGPLPAPIRRDLQFFDRLALFLVFTIVLQTISTHGILVTKAPLELLVLGIVHGARERMVRLSKQGIEPTFQAGLSTLRLGGS